MALNVGELYATMGLDTRQFDQGLAGLDSGLGTIRRGITKAVKAGGALAMAFSGVALATGYKRLTSIEDATAAITIQLGDATKAADLMNQVLDTSRGTPFSFDQFASATRTLVAMSVPAEKIPGYLRAFGEAAAASGQGAAGLDQISTAMGKMAATGQVALDDVWSLSNAGVPALAILANGFNVTRENMKKMITNGAVPAGKALDVLTKGIMEGTSGSAGATNKLAGSMLALGDTTSGSLGNARAAVARFGATALKPVFERLPGLLQGASKWLDTLGAAVGPAIAGFLDSPQVADFVERLRDGIVSLASSDALRSFIGELGELAGHLIRIGTKVLPPLLRDLTQVGKVIAGAVMAAVSGLNGVLGPLSRHAEVLLPIIEGLLAAFVGFKVLVGVAKAVAAVRAAFAALQALWAASPVGLVVIGVVALGAALYAAYRHVKPFRDAVDKVGRTLRDKVWPAIQQVATAVGTTLVKAWDAIKGPTATVLGVIMDLGKGFSTYMVEPIRTAVAVVTALFRGDFSRAFDLVVGLPGRLIDGFGDLPGQLAGLLAQVPGLILDMFAGAGKLLLTAGRAILTGLVTGLTEVLPWLLGFAAGIPVRLVDAAGEAGLWLLAAGKDAILGLLRGVIDNLPQLIAFVHGLPQRVWDALTGMYSKLAEVGKNLIHGLWSGAWNAVGYLKDNVGKIPGWITAALAGLYNALKDVGKQMIHGLWEGIKGAGGWLKDKIGGFKDSIVGGFTTALGINSPSRVMMPVGSSVAEGLAVGMTRATRLVTQASVGLSKAATPVVTAPTYTAAVSTPAGAATSQWGAGAPVGDVTAVRIDHAEFASDLDINRVLSLADFALTARAL